jgi:NADPH:quinone reductase-like Zn-dependent oxidoreductase
VKTVAVALNPTDWQGLEGPLRSGSENLLLGTDFAGIVQAVGKGVRKGFEIGDRIAGMAHGSKAYYARFMANYYSWGWLFAPDNDLEPEDGTFAEYIMVKGDIAMHVPPNISFEQAATLGCGIETIALGLYKYLQLPPPTSLLNISDRTPILIYGGSSATGTLAVQFAKLYVTPLR